MCYADLFLALGQLLCSLKKYQGKKMTLKKRSHQAFCVVSSHVCGCGHEETVLFKHVRVVTHD